MTPTLPDLSACDREPIHVPSGIQPHGILFTLSEPDFRVRVGSANCSDLIGIPTESLVGRPVKDVVGPEGWKQLESGLLSSTFESNPLYLCTVPIGPKAKLFHAVAHRYRGLLFLELEPAEQAKDITFQDLYPLVRSFMAEMRGAADIHELSDRAAKEVRRITGFDRVLVYKFHSNWDGHVIGESRNDVYPPLHDLWFPASDIPAQARALYATNRIRLIPNARYRPVLIGSLESGEPLDLSYAMLRSVSPVHLEYLGNMGVVASMSISIIVGEAKLWGLIACHHHQPRMVPFDVRTACDLLGQALSVQVESTERRSEYERKIELQLRVTRLLGLMAQEDDLVDSLVGHPAEIMRFAEASGAAVVFDGQCRRLGDCPAEDDVWRLVDWMIQNGSKDVFATDRLALDLPQFEHFRRIASGVLAISLSKIHRNFILWFRPEVVQTVTWSGEPVKGGTTAYEHGGRIHPRKSFEAWKETVRGQSIPWSSAEIASAEDLRNAVIEIALRKAEELAQLSAELQRSNQELEAFSYSVSHDLRAPFRHIVGYAELLKQSATAHLENADQRYLNIIIKSANFAGTLVDDLLHYSKVGRAKLKRMHIDVNALVEEVRRDLDSEYEKRVIDWRIGKLPEAEGDLLLLRLVLQNLLQNAIKYTRSRAAAIIEITGEQRGDELVYRVRDNGVGFDQAYADKLFGVFQRLHKMEDYEGTGVGLANVRRIVGKHGGQTWAEGKVGEGASFYFSLPQGNSGAIAQ